VLIETVLVDQTVADGFAGSGDTMSDFFVPTDTGAIPYEVSHNGRRNFIVKLHCVSGSTLVQNEIGVVSGSTVVRLKDEPCLWEVEADGEWSLTPRR
jgi:hypothetical protein